MSCYFAICFQSREGDCRRSHTFSFSEHCPDGVYSMSFDPGHSVLYVGTCAKTDDATLLSTSSADSSTASLAGVTAWRVLSDSPHYKLVTDYEIDSAKVIEQESPLIGWTVQNVTPIWTHFLRLRIKDFYFLAQQKMKYSNPTF